MSKMFFAGLSIVIFIILMINVYKTHKRNDRMRKSVTFLLLGEAFSIVGYSVVLFTEEYQLLSLSYSLYSVSMNVVRYAILRYALDFTRHKEEVLVPFNRKILYTIKAILFVDSISMLCNVLFEHAAVYKVAYYQGERYLKNTPMLSYNVHLILGLVLFITAVYLLVRKIVMVPKLYRKKYFMALVPFVILAVADSYNTIFKPVVNIMVYIYAIAVLLIDYFTFKYIPKYLEQYIQRLAQDKQQDMVVMFDNEDNCVYMNGNASLFLSENGHISKESYEQEWNYEANSSNIAVREKDGKKHYFIKEYEALSDEQGKYMGCFYIMHDITKEREIQEKYRYLATHDTVTGLYNRTYFFEKAEEFMRCHPNEKYVIVCSDIRQFNAINDIFGIETGDRVLKVIAEQLIKEDDNNRVYGRIAGDSFALCIAKDKFEEIAPLLEKSNTLHVKNVNYPILIHLGVYEVKDLSISVANMCDRAILAIDSIKNDMQKGVAYYNNEIREKMLQEKSILRDLIPAFEEKQFTIYLQPQIRHSTGSIVGAETLVRWIHPEKGVITPDMFIPLMENNGLISRLDQYIWRMACEQVKRYEEKGLKISLSVNISAKDFYYLDIYEELMGLVREYDIEPSRLKLEITESAVMLDVSKQVALIRRLQKEGFVFEMDDFGSGYSSLNTLKDIPVDILKLDLKFMGKAEDAERSADILQMVVGMARKLHMPVIAEGVEMKEQADFLGSIGCDIIQGYYYAKPMPIEEFDKLLEQYPYQELMERV